MKIAAIAMCAALSLVGCKSAPPARVTTVEVPVYVRYHVASNLLASCAIAEPYPLCTRNGKPEYCNGQLAAMRLEYRAAIAKCDADKAAIKAADK